MPRTSFTLNGADYPLTHLQSFRVTVAQKDPLAAPAILQVTSSHHVFSEKWDAFKHPPQNHYVENGESRSFCPVRYGCSIKLRTLIEYHIGGKAFLGRDGNGVWNHFFHGEADGIAYPIYFRLGRADKIPGVHGVMHIISAYQNPNLPAKNKFQAIKFARLVHQTCPPPAPA